MLVVFQGASPSFESFEKVVMAPWILDMFLVCKGGNQLLCLGVGEERHHLWQTSIKVQLYKPNPPQTNRRLTRAGLKTSTADT